MAFQETESNWGGIVVNNGSIQGPKDVQKLKLKAIYSGSSLEIIQRKEDYHSCIVNVTKSIWLHKIIWI